MNKIDISTEEKKKEVYELFNSFNKKGDIYEYFNINDNVKGVEYINKIAEEIGFDFNVYKERKKRYCLQCGKELHKGQKKFCSSSCAAKYNNKSRNKKEKPIVTQKKSKVKKEKIMPAKKEKQKIYCLQCGKELNRHQKLFCSNECCQEYKKEKTIKEWLNGKNCGKKSDGTIPKNIKGYLLEKNEYKCSSCGFEGYNKTTGNSILQFHHIDGDAYNNNIENIVVLCPNCHAMTENFMNLNKGKSTRINRYKK